MENNYENLSDEQLADRVMHEFKADGVDEYVDSHADERKGLGDTIEKVLNSLGVTPKNIERIFGVDSGGCGCGKRKKFLNRLFPHFNKYKEEKVDEE
jgi:hypothetical protein